MTAAASHTAIGSRAAAQGGFTYLSVIVLVAIIGLVTATTLKVGSVLQRSRAERELLYIGAAFSDALQSYASATPSGQPTQPGSLRDLLKDPRFPGTRRHLRKIFVDPITGKAEWGLVRLGDAEGKGDGKGGIVAVYSLSDARPVKVGNFPTRFQAFEGRAHISDWKFTLTGKPATAAPVGPAQPSIPLKHDGGADGGRPSAPAPATTGAAAPAVAPAPTPSSDNGTAAPPSEPPAAPADAAPPAAEHQ